MKIITNDPRLKEPVEWANKYYESADFGQDVLSVTSFDHANVKPSEILSLFNQFKGEIEVKCTYFGWFYRNVLGRTVGNGYAYVNSSGLSRQRWELGATVVHETGHVVDEFYPKASFGHGSNSSKGKQKSFSYYIDEKAENWIKLEVLKKESQRLVIRKIMLRSSAA